MLSLIEIKKRNMNSGNSNMYSFETHKYSIFLVKL